MVDLPLIMDMSNKAEIKNQTENFLDECTKKLKLKFKLQSMFRLVKKNQIAVSSTEEGVQFKQEMVPEKIKDIS